MSEEPTTAEDAAAGLLNGTMISLLGSLLPGIFIWQAVTQPARWDLSPAALSDAAPFFGGVLLSLFCLRSGVRMLLRNWKYFRRRPAASSPE